jgi:hypothetical protein
MKPPVCTGQAGARGGAWCWGESRRESVRSAFSHAKRTLTRASGAGRLTRASHAYLESTLRPVWLKGELGEGRDLRVVTGTQARRMIRAQAAARQAGVNSCM